jgi:hypothetical protein
VPGNALPKGDADVDAERAGMLAAGIVLGCLPGNGERAKGYHHDRASEDVVRGDLTTSLRSSTVGAALALPCLAKPRRGATSAGSLPSPEGDESHFLGIYSIAAPAVAFVFFPQVGLRMAPHRPEAMVDGSTTPWVGRWAVEPYLLAW